MGDKPISIQQTGNGHTVIIVEGNGNVVCPSRRTGPVSAKTSPVSGPAQVLIHNPVPGDFVAHKVRIEGTAHGIAPETILRTVILPSTLPTYQPQTGRLHIDPETHLLRGTTYVGNDEYGSHTAERFRILVVKCSEEAEDELDAYLCEAHELGFPGIRRLPHGTKVLAELSVVRDDYRATEMSGQMTSLGGERQPASEVHVCPQPSKTKVPRGEADTWSDITFYKVNGDILAIRTSAPPRRYHYADLGFARANNREKTIPWKLLIETCEGNFAHEGFCGYNGKALDGDAVKRQMSTLRNKLRAIFGLDEDPFHLFSTDDTDGGWHPRSRCHGCPPEDVDTFVAGFHQE